jgi:hypothetical protein
VTLREEHRPGVFRDRVFRDSVFRRISGPEVKRQLAVFIKRNKNDQVKEDEAGRPLAQMVRRKSRRRKNRRRRRRRRRR